MAVTSAWVSGSSMASASPFWIKVGEQVVEYWCIRSSDTPSFLSVRIQPSRQPVMAYVLENPLMIRLRSFIPGNSQMDVNRASS